VLHRSREDARAAERDDRMSNISVFSIIALAPSLMLIACVVLGLTGAGIRHAAERYAPRARALARRAQTTAVTWMRTVTRSTPPVVEFPARLSHA
jgi:hypothetical protein